jgi:hypothetical protein
VLLHAVAAIVTCAHPAWSRDFFNLNRSLATDSLAAGVARSDSLAAGVARSDSLAAGVARSDSLAARVVPADPLAAQVVRADSLTSFPPPHVRAWQVGLVRGDRLQHASLSFALTSALIIATRNRAAGAATALAAGLGKELWDGRQGHFDPVDLAADAVGVGLATWMVAPRGP